jgi:sugar (pentulose or hexulose) kinase
MAETKYLAFDMGAESGRAIIGTLADGKISLQEVHRFLNPNGKVNGHFHWNLIGQWEELKTGLRKAAAAAGQSAIAGLGVDTWGVDFGLIDKSGELLGNPYMYRDCRNDGMIESLCQRVSREKVFQATGLQFLQFNTLFQLYSMVRSDSSQLKLADRMLFMPDLFNYLFTGVKKNEFSIASTSQMYDPREKTWALPLLREVGIPTHILCDIVPAGSILGPLKKEVADECGTGPIPVIAPACHDTGSAVAAVPAELDGWCYISSGTWSLMGVELPKPLINEKSLQYNYTNEGGVGGTIRFLKNIMGLWPIQECRRQWLKDGTEYNYAQLAQMAAQSKPFLSIINPDHPPFLSPGDMPRKIEEFCRQTKQPVPSNPGEFVRVCLEGLALTYRRTLDGLEDILGHKIRVIHIVGGGCQNELLNQMTADACARPVLTGPIEATALGNLLTQAIATGDVKSLDELRAIVRNSFPIKRYEPQDTATWEKAYGRYREVL